MHLASEAEELPVECPTWSLAEVVIYSPQSQKLVVVYGEAINYKGNGNNPAIDVIPKFIGLIIHIYMLVLVRRM